MGEGIPVLPALQTGETGAINEASPGLLLVI